MYKIREFGLTTAEKVREVRRRVSAIISIRGNTMVYKIAIVDDEAEVVESLTEMLDKYKAETTGGGAINSNLSPVTIPTAPNF